MKLLALILSIAGLAAAQTPPPGIMVGTDAPNVGICSSPVNAGNIYVRSENAANGPIQVLRCTQLGATTFQWMPIDHLVVATLPATCSIGDIAYSTTATAGQNIYGCTAVNTWTVQGGAGGIPLISPSVQGVLVGDAGGGNIGDCGSAAVGACTVPNLLTTGSFVGGVASSANPTAPFQARVSSAVQWGISISNNLGSSVIDPWFHVSNIGVGLLGNYSVNPGSPTIPFFSIESDTTLAAELRSTLLPQSHYATIWAKSTNSSTQPMDLYLEADRNLYLHAGANENSAVDNNGLITLSATTGVTMNTAVAGSQVTYATFSPTGSHIYVNTAGTNAINFDNGGPGTGQRIYGGGSLMVAANSTNSLYLFGGGSNHGITIATGGNVSMDELVIYSTVYSAAGTPLPTCNSGTKSARATVSDATLPTYLGAYTSGGAVIAPVFCNGSGWLTD